MTRARVGVVVLDHGRPDDAARAASSAQDASTGARVLIVENGANGAGATAGNVLRLTRNLGFAGGMNAGIEHLSAEGCERFLLLNNDATLEPGCLGLLSLALEDPRLAAAGPVILASDDGRIESRGLSVDLRWGRVRLDGHGERIAERPPLVAAQALSGAVLMLSRSAVERVGLLDEAYFFSFEDVDWCVRARQAGLGVAVVSNARARHAGSRTLGRGSPERLYYAARNHLRMVEKLLPLRGAARWLRRGLVLARNLAHASTQTELPRAAARSAVLEGFRDACRSRFGERRAARS